MIAAKPKEAYKWAALLSKATESLRICLAFLVLLAGCGSKLPTLSPTLHPVGTPAPTTRPASPPTDTPVSKPTTPEATPTQTPPSLVGPLVVGSYADFQVQAAIPVYDLGTRRSVPLPFSRPANTVFIEDWSPDGCQLIVSPKPSGQVASYLLNVVTLEVEPFTIQAYDSMLYSPDGEWLAYVDDQGDDSPRPGNVYLLNIDGSKHVQLTDDAKRHRLDSWSHDSLKVLYWTQQQGSPGNGTQELRAVNIHTREQCVIARFHEPLSQWEDLYLADVDSCRQISLPYSGSLEKAAYVGLIYSPGHRYVAIILEPIGGGGDFVIYGRLFLLDTKTKNVYPVGDGGMYLSNFLAWSPDGTILVLVATFDGQTENGPVYLVNAETGSIQALDIESAYAPSWSPDGQMLAFQSTTPDKGPFIYYPQTKEVVDLPIGFGDYMMGPLLWSPRMSYNPEACR